MAWGGGREGGEELARARSGEGSWRREGGQEGVGWGGGDRIGTMGRRLGGGNGEGEMEREQLEGGDGEGATGRGRREGGKGEGEKKGQEEEAFYRWIRFNVIGYRIELQANSICLGRQRLWCSPLATSTCNAWVE